MLRNADVYSSMIKSFKHKGLQKYFETGNTSGIQPAHEKKIRMRLTALHTATLFEDLDLPGFRLYKLKGKMDGIEAAETIIKTSSAHIIYITGNTDEATKKRALSTKPKAYLGKPIDCMKLIELLHSVK